jgi:hypothetical protein
METQPIPSAVPAGGYGSRDRDGGERRAFTQPAWEQARTGSGVGGGMGGMGGRGSSYGKADIVYPALLRHGLTEMQTGQDFRTASHSHSPRDRRIQHISGTSHTKLPNPTSRTSSKIVRSRTCALWRTR